jgi:hypothetical protein
MDCRSLISAIGLILLALAGCESEPSPLAPVRGKVSYKGIPLRGGSIVFTPDPDRNRDGPIAEAEIQPDGTYALLTDKVPGAVPGWHRVTVIWLDDSIPPRSLVPGRYGDPERSGLRFEIKPGQANLVDIDLE